MYTSHGHHIPGTIVEPLELRPQVARCGGLLNCTLCIKDSVGAFNKKFNLNIDPRDFADLIPAISKMGVTDKVSLYPGSIVEDEERLKKLVEREMEKLESDDIVPPVNTVRNESIGRVKPNIKCPICDETLTLQEGLPFSVVGRLVEIHITDKHPVTANTLNKTHTGAASMSPEDVKKFWGNAPNTPKPLPNEEFAKFVEETKKQIDEYVEETSVPPLLYDDIRNEHYPNEELLKMSNNPIQHDDGYEPKISSTSELDIQMYQRKPFEVEAVQVSEKNFKAVAEWCGGAVVTVQEAQEGILKHLVKRYISVDVHRPLSKRQTEAHVGDWVLHVANKGFKVYGSRPFQKNFELRNRPSNNSYFDKSSFDEPQELFVTSEEVRDV